MNQEKKMPQKEPQTRPARVTEDSGRKNTNHQQDYQAKATASYATDSAPRRMFNRSFRFWRFRIDSDAARGAGSLFTKGPPRFRRRRRSCASWICRSRKSSAAAMRASATSLSELERESIRTVLADELRFRRPSFAGPPIPHASQQSSICTTSSAGS